jgi:hypothetical protein
MSHNALHTATDTLVHWYTGTLVHWYTGTLIHWYTGTLVHWYTDTLVHCYTGTLVRELKYYFLFLVINPTRCNNFSHFILEIKLYVFRTVPLSIIRSFSLYTQQWCTSYRFVDSFRSAGSVPSWSCSKAVYKPVWHIPLLSVQWITPDNGSGWYHC